MKKFFFLLSGFLFTGILATSAQEISGVVLDSQTRAVVPFASIQFAPNRGAITNDEGLFSIPSAESDSIKVSCLGYEPVSFKAAEMTNDTVFLKPSSIQLDDVFLSNRNLNGEEIVERAMARIEDNNDLGLTRRKFFLRNSFVNHVNSFDLEVEKTTMPELDQDFMNELESKMPKYIDSYNEYLGDSYGNYENQKVQLLKADRLENPVNDESLQELNHRVERLLQEKVGEGTYLKVKSGIIGVKMDSEELNKEIEEGREAEEPKVKTPEEKVKEQLESRKNAQDQAQNIIKKEFSKMFWNEDLDLDVFEKMRKYEFKLEGFAQLDNSIVYIISFEPKRKADYYGRMYINTEDFGIHRLDFENLRPLKKFRLFGISSIDDVHRGKVIFNRNEEGKYDLKYLEEERGTTVGVERPLSFLVKKGKFLWKKKLDELDLEMNINISSLNKTQLLIYENSPLPEEQFEALKPSADFKFETFKKYNPDFWSGTNIIEPNEAIRSFISLESE